MDSANGLTEEQYRGSIKKLIRNVLFRHDACIASRNLNPHKIICLYQKRVSSDFPLSLYIILFQMAISELGESLVERDLNLRVRDTLYYEPEIELLESQSYYNSPTEREILDGKKVTTYDPFKSEIYSLGKIILEICLIKYKNYF